MVSTIFINNNVKNSLNSLLTPNADDRTEPAYRLTQKTSVVGGPLCIACQRQYLANDSMEGARSIRVTPLHGIWKVSPNGLHIQIRMQADLQDVFYSSLQSFVASNRKLQLGLVATRLLRLHLRAIYLHHCLWKRYARNLRYGSYLLILSFCSYYSMLPSLQLQVAWWSALQKFIAKGETWEQ